MRRHERHLHDARGLLRVSVCELHGKGLLLLHRERPHPHEDAHAWLGLGLGLG